MKSIAFLLLFIFLANFSFANKRHLEPDTAYPTYSLQKDKHWLDSLKRIVRNFYSENEYSKNFNTSQLSYVETCVKLGVYYEQMYDLKQLPNMKKAVYYYENVTDIGIMSGEESYKASAIKMTLCRKLENIYYKGKGVKKNFLTSYRFAVRGCTNNDFFAFYSKRYFGNTKIVLNDFTKYDFTKDSAFEIAANPFFVKANKGLPIKADLKTLLTKIGNLYKEKFVNKGYNILITANLETSLRAQMVGYKSLESVSAYLEQTMGVIRDNIITDTMIDNAPVFGDYKSIKNPYITIIFAP